MTYHCATCREPVDPHRPARFFQVFICTKRAGLERSDEQFFCSSRCLSRAAFLPDSAARVNHYRCPACETEVCLTPESPYAVCPCGFVVMERQEEQVVLYLGHLKRAWLPDAAPAPLAAAVQPEQAPPLVRLETDLLLARARIKKLEQAQDALQDNSTSLERTIERIYENLHALKDRMDVQERTAEGFAKQLGALQNRVAALEARPAVPRVDVVVRQGAGY